MLIIVCCTVSINQSFLISSRPCTAYTSDHCGFLCQPVSYDGSSWDERIPDQPRHLSRSHFTTDECCSCCRLWTLTNCNYSSFYIEFMNQKRVCRTQLNECSSSHMFIHIFHLHQFVTTSPHWPLYELSSMAVGCSSLFAKWLWETLNIHPVFP